MTSRFDDRYVATVRRLAADIAEGNTRVTATGADERLDMQRLLDAMRLAETDTVPQPDLTFALNTVRFSADPNYWRNYCQVAVETLVNNPL